jgi:site-specific DNA-cytosine methylase
LKVAILCEKSGKVRDAFIKRGHDAISCDIEPTRSPGPHMQGDCKNYDWSDYDLIIAHPPCTFLSVVANRALKENPDRIYDRFYAFDFFMWCYYLPAKKICVENPKGYINSHFRKPDQIIQPYFFGDPEMKTTCLWLRGLPSLIHAETDELFFKKTHVEKPKPKYICNGEKSKGKKIYFVESNPGKEKRSETFPGIANAMAKQWG